MFINRANSNANNTKRNEPLDTLEIMQLKTMGNFYVKPKVVIKNSLVKAAAVYCKQGPIYLSRDKLKS